MLRWEGSIAGGGAGWGYTRCVAARVVLSDLVNNKTSIDSLFLDEGFGSLETALTALDSLNASGKMIGIISHVEVLKERIPAQIRVEKGGGAWGTRGWLCRGVCTHGASGLEHRAPSPSIRHIAKDFKGHPVQGVVPDPAAVTFAPQRENCGCGKKSWRGSRAMRR